MSTDFILMMPAGGKAPQLHSVILEEQTGFTLADVCRACAVERDLLLALVEEGVLTPHSPEPPGQDMTLWRFTGVHVHRARVAVRLQNDLGVNLAGVALALQLMDELQALRHAAAARQAGNVTRPDQSASPHDA